MDDESQESKINMVRNNNNTTTTTTNNNTVLQDAPYYLIPS